LMDNYRMLLCYCCNLPLLLCAPPAMAGGLAFARK